MLIGTTRGLGGGWGEEFVAHQSQLVAVPDAVADEEAVLIEPLACSVQAVRANLPPAGARVLVIGSGAIGLVTVAALQALSPAADVTIVARYPFQAEQAERLGAARTVSGRGDYFEALAEISGARLLKPIIGKRIAVGGFDQVYVCVGGVAGMEDALRFTRSGGTIVLLGNSTLLNGIDWSPGLAQGADHPRQPLLQRPLPRRRRRPRLHRSRRPRRRRPRPLAPLLTHTFRLDQLRDALLTAMDKKGSGSIKVAFRY
jgi:threonine dehydrogenase-like Zn-dependent dehydrogenase